MKLSAWIEKKLESPEFRNQYISDLKEENKRLESKLKVAVDVLKYIFTYVRYGDATVMRLAAFAGESLKTIQGKGDGG